MSNTSHVIEIKFVSNTAGAVKPTTDLTKGVDTLTKSTTTLNKEGKGTVDLFAQTQKSGEMYFKTTGKVTKGQTDVSKSSNDTNKSLSSASSTTEKYGNANTKTAGTATKLSGSIRPLAFSFTSIATAGIEAVGMYGAYESASQKVAVAQEQLNLLTAAGMEGTAEYAAAEQQLAEAQRGQQFAQRILILSFSDLIPMSLMAGNTIMGIVKTMKEAKGATDTLAQSTTALANAKKTAAVPALMDFNNVLTQTPILSANVDKGLQATTKVIQQQQGPLKQLGVVSIETFEGIDLSARNSGAQITKSGSIFTRFGATAMSALTGISGGLKAAGAAVLAFGRTLTTAFLSNPIGLIIAGISLAIGALVFDLGGFRTALNNLGVTLGKMAPWAKPFLDMLGWIGDALGGVGDWIKGILGFGDAVEESGTKAEDTTPKIDSLTLAYNEAYTAGTQFANMDAINNALSNTEKAFETLTAKIEEHEKVKKGSFEDTFKLGPEVQAAYSTMNKAAMDYFDTIVVKSEPVKAAIKQFSDLWKQYNEDGVITREEAQKLHEVFNKTKGIMDENVKTVKEKIDVDNEANQKTQDATLVNNDLTGQLALLNLELADGKSAQGELTKAQEHARQVVAGYLSDTAQTKTASEELKLELLENASAVEAFGQNLQFADATTIDYGKSVIATVDAHQQAQAEADKFWNILKTGMDTVGKESFPVVMAAMEKLKIIAPEVYDIVVAKLEEYQKANGLTTEFVKEAEEVDTSHIEKLQEKADKLKMVGLAQDLLQENTKESLAQAEILIQTEENFQESQDKSLQKLRDMAKQRGASDAVLLGSIDNLQKYIQTNDIVIDMETAVNEKLTELVAKRQESEAAIKIETKAYQQLIEQMDIGVDTTGMSSEGMQELIGHVDNFTNASQAATDEIVNWQAELKTAQKVESVTIEQLQALAKELGVTIPDHIMSEGIPAIKKFIEAEMGIGDAAKEAAQNAKDAFNDLATEASKAIEDMIKDDVLAGKAKKVIKQLEEIGVAAESLQAQQAIIHIGAETVDFEDKISSIPEIIAQTFGSIDTSAQAETVINMFSESMQSELGDKLPMIGDTINSLWSFVKTEYAELKAQEQVQKFREIIGGNPEQFYKAAQMGMVDPVTGAVGEGFGDVLSGMADEKIQQLAEVFGGKGAVFKKTGEGWMLQTASGIKSTGGVVSQSSNDVLGKVFEQFGTMEPTAKEKGKKIPENVAAGIDEGKPMVENAAGNLVTASGTQFGLLENEAKTGTEPIPGIFSQAFLDASNQAGTQLQTMVTNLHTAFSSMSTSVATYSTSMQTNFSSFLMYIGAMLPVFATGLQGLQQVFSTLSTSVATYSTSMQTNIANFIKTTGDNINLFITQIQAFQQVMSTLSTSWATYMDSMTANAASFTQTTTTNLETLITDGIDATHTQTSDLSSNWATYMKSMAGNADAMMQNTVSAFEAVINSSDDLHGEMSELSSNFATYMDSMAENAEAMADDVTSAFDDIGSAAAAAERKVRGLIDALNDLQKAGGGGGSVQFGGSYFMKDGGSFIAKSFMRYGGHSMGEYGKSEMVNVTPLTDPSNISNIAPGIDTHGINNFFRGQSPSSTLTRAPMSSAVQMATGGGGGIGPGSAGAPNINFTGQAHITIMSPNGNEQAKIVAPLVFKNVSTMNIR